MSSSVQSSTSYLPRNFKREGAVCSLCIAGGDDTYLCDHAVDGNVFLPVSSTLNFMACQHEAKQNQQSLSKDSMSVHE